MHLSTRIVSALLLIAASTGTWLLTMPSEVARLEPSVMVQTEMRSSTLLATHISTWMKMELETSTGLQTIQGEPPNVSITDQKWNAPLLTVFFKNNGGSGTITLQFSISGSKQYDTLYLDAGASATKTWIFQTIGRFTGPPDVQIIAQQATSGVQTRTVQIVNTKVYTFYGTEIVTSTAHWTETTFLTTQRTIKTSAFLMEILAGTQTGPLAGGAAILLGAAAGLSGVALFIMEWRTRRLVNGKQPSLGGTYEKGASRKQVPETGWAVKKVKEIPATKLISPEEEDDSSDEKVYRYIAQHEGVISISRAATHLSMTEHELKKAIERLKSQGRIGEFV